MNTKNRRDFIGSLSVAVAGLVALRPSKASADATRCPNGKDSKCPHEWCFCDPRTKTCHFCPWGSTQADNFRCWCTFSLARCKQHFGYTANTKYVPRRDC